MGRRTGRARTLWLALALSLVMWSLPLGAAAAPGQERSEWLIGFDGDLGPSELAQVERAGGEVVRELNGLPVVLAELADPAAERLAETAGVRYVEPNGRMHALNGHLPWGVERIDAPGAWSNLDGSDPDTAVEPGSAGDGVTVAVLDTGISNGHVPTAHCTDIAEERDCDDVYGHGTHVAGTIAASHDSLTPGIAAGVSLHDVKVLGDDGSGTYADIAEGITIAATGVEDGIAGADVINMSLGGSSSSETLQLAVRDAEAAGVLLVAAAGNGGNRGGNNDSVSYPAKYEEVIAVAATDQDDERATFSSTGPDVEIAAPGVGIPSTWPDEGNHSFDDCGDDCDYHDGSGTSMASPHVAGAAALAFAADANIDAVQVRAALGSTAEPLDQPAHQVGAGLVDAAALVQHVIDLGGGDGEDGGTDGGGDNGSGGDDETDPTVTEANVDYSTRGGREKDRHLDIATTLRNDDGTVPDTDVTVEVTHDDEETWTFNDTTGSDGTVTFTIKNASTGEYTTDVTHVAGVAWDGTINDGTYTKE